MSAANASLRLLGSEMHLIVGRRRNQAGILVLAAVPILIAVALKYSSPGRGRGTGFIASATSNGIFVALSALTIELALFLPLAVAVLSGDAIAGEANTGTLRYLLTVPVQRTRLLVIKYISLVIGAFVGVLVVTVAGIIADAIDGMAARHFKQSSDFGAVLDMVTDRCSTAGFLLIISHLCVPSSAFLAAAGEQLIVSSTRVPP